MTWLNRKRKRSRDQVRYRLHTTIEAVAYLADDPSDQDVDRELSKIMAGPQKKRSAARPERTPLTASRVAAAVLSALTVTGAVLLAFTLHSPGLAFVGLAQIGIVAAGYLVGRGGLAMLLHGFPSSRMTGSIRMERGTRPPGEADPITESHQEQTFLFFRDTPDLGGHETE